MDIQLPRLMDRNLNEIKRLRPIQLSISESLTPLSTASMTIPLDEAVITVGMFVALSHAGGDAGVYRVVSVKQVLKDGGYYDVQMEHGICTLSDAVIAGYVELGGSSMPIEQTIRALLSRQNEKYWTMGECDYTDQLQYSWENENLLTAIISTASHLTDAYWSFDMQSSPWRLSLKKMRTDDACECRMSRNIDEVKIQIDRTNLCTRITPLGYGEGVNQLNIKRVNDGKAYMDADTIGIWGIAHTVYTEKSIDKPQTLKAAAAALLEKSKNPTVSVELAAADLYSITGEDIDRFYIGRLCRMPLPDYGITMDERVVAINRSDVFGAPAQVQITLANKQKGAAGDLAGLSRKSAISELYSQGAASQFAVNFADNADPSHPARMDFYIDKDAIHVNAVQVKFKASAFRGYSKAAKAGGAGATTSSSENVEVQVDFSDRSAYNVSCSQPKNEPFGKAIIYTSGMKHIDEDHDHNFDHFHDIDLDLSDLNLVTTVPAHNHRVSLPAHSHEIELGIFEGATASAISVKVDGKTVPGKKIKRGEFNAVDYLKKDQDGRITRGEWHTIEFTPNSLTRITASAYIRSFVRSLTGEEV